MKTIVEAIAPSDFLSHYNWSKEDYVVNIPNEIFDDLKKSEINTLKHKAFAYSYYYLCCYLYRNYKYGTLTPFSKVFSQSILYSLAEKGKKFNYITKRNGVLDNMGYTKSQFDFPIYAHGDEGGLTEFAMYSEMEEEFKEAREIPANFICKFPIKAFYRNIKDKHYTGTFYNAERTHMVDMPILAQCLTHKDLSFECFYLYGYLKAFRSIFAKKAIHKEYIATSIGTTRKTLVKYIGALEELNLIKVHSHTPIKFNFNNE